MKATHRTAVVAMVAGTLATGAFVGAAPAAAAAWDSCDLRVKVSELRRWDRNGEYNIIVWKGTAFQSAKFNGVVINDTDNRRECPDPIGQTDNYHWVVFKSGQFTRKGDGGYKNWAFYGKWDRKNDKNVVFHSR